MFIDDVKIKIKAGKGGNGIVAFRREKYVEFGGPGGGNGGMGGSVYFVGDPNKNTLYDLKLRTHLTAENGENGKSKGMHGANANDLYFNVPLGTIVYKNNVLVGEVTKEGETLLLAKGGKGGRGNISLSTSKNPAPDYAENGDLGETFEFRIVLKLLADVGLIGFPNAGKSSLISVLSNAKPKIADYPFTSLTPTLGVVNYLDQSLVFADLPGLIVGASTGLGLGFRFLKHIERTKVFVYVIDGSVNNAYEMFLSLQNELRIFNESMLSKPYVVIINKMDLLTNIQMDVIKTSFPFKIVFTSAATFENLNKVKKAIFSKYLEYKEEIKTPESFQVYAQEIINNTINVEKLKDIFYVTGEDVYKQFNRVNIDNQASIMRFIRILRNMGLEKKLHEFNVKDGDTVNIYGLEFDYYDE